MSEARYRIRRPRDDSDAVRRGGSAWSRRLGNAALLGLLGVALGRSVFFVDQTEYAVVTQFGEPVQFRSAAGLGFKWPFQSVWRFDRRLHVHAPPGREMLTEDKENLNVEWYACWRIAGQAPPESSDRPTREADAATPDVQRHVQQFLQSVGTVETANRRLEERIQSAIAAELGHVRMDQIVSLEPSGVRLPEALSQVAARLRDAVLAEYGIELIDVRVRRFNYPESVKPAVFAEIRSERMRVAEQYRAEGRSQAARLRSLAELHRDQVLSQARREAARVRGEGEAKAMETANAAHRQDPEFYELLKTLEAVKAVLDDQTTVVLSTDSPLLRLLTRGLPPPGETKSAPVNVPAARQATAAPPIPGAAP